MTGDSSSDRERSTGEAPVSFGYRKISAADKPSMVQSVFRNVASRYDLMNDVMSAGTHRLWKAALVDWLAPRPGLRVLDMAGGTGDIAFRIHTRCPDSDILVCDLTEEMLNVGRDRAVDRGILKGLDWLCADAETLPLRDRSVEAYTVSFGLRNVTHLEHALAEAYRVLKPGGRFLCLEFSQVALPLLRDAYDLYSFRIIPRLGEVIARDRESYQYLVESIRRFPDQDGLARRMAAAGLARVQYRNLMGGVAALHSGWRL